MTAAAVIFSSLADREAAHLCADRLRGQGWEPVVALDAADGPPGTGEILTTFPRNGMIGTPCAVGIFRALLDRPGDTLAKIDADAWLSDDGASWLAGAVDRARGFAMGRVGRMSGGAWAAPRGHVAAALRALERQPCRTCGESFLVAAAFGATGGHDLAGGFQVWRAGRPIFSGSALVTLPSRMPADARRCELSELFSRNS